MTDNPSKGKSPETIDEYLSGYPAEQQAALQALRERIHAIVPGLTESISYQVPVFKYKGHSLVGFGAFNKHLSFFVMSSPAVMAHFQEALEGFRHSGSTIQFQPETPLPDRLLRNIIDLRLQENDLRYQKKKSA